MNRVAKNAIWIIMGKVVQSLLALFINMLTARYLGPSNYGLITYASSLVSFVTPLVRLGFDNILVQEIVNNPEEEGKILGSTICISLLTSVVGVIGVFAFSYIANPNEIETYIVCFLYSLILLFQAIDLIQYWFQAKLLSKYSSIASLCAYILVSVYKIFLLVTKKNIYWFALSNTLDIAFICILNYWFYYQNSSSGLSFSLSTVKKLFNKSKHFIISNMMIVIFTETDKVMIKSMIGKAEIGYYGAAVACAGLTSFIFAAIIDSFRPVIFEAKKESDDLFEKRIVMLYAVIIYLSLAQCLVISVFSKLIINILYGESFLPAATALAIIVWYTTFSYIGSVRNIWLLANSEHQLIWKISVVGALTNIFLNLILIKQYGINGAAFASLFTQFTMNFVLGFFIKKIYPNNILIIKSLNPKVLLSVFNQLLKK